MDKSEPRWGDFASSKVGLIVLALLAVVLAFMYATIRQHGDIGRAVGGQPKLDPPMLVASAQEPSPLVVGQGQPSRGVDSCVVASINGAHYDRTVTLQRGTVVGLGGWLIDKMSRSVPDRAWIVMVGAAAADSYQVPILLHEKRPDVSEYFGGVRGYRNSGFIVDIASQGLPKDTYHVYIVFEHRGDYYTCDNDRHLALN